MIQRKLASIQVINKLSNIENADSIEVASVLGWKVVVRKGEFKEMDKIVFCEVDSFIPEEIAPFLTKDKPKIYNGIKGNRLKTVKLRGQISQGLILPLSILADKTDINKLQIGDDVSSLLGIVKWEQEIPAYLAGQVKGDFPSLIPKTDEIRVQQDPEVLKEFWDKEFYITTKCDGTSLTVYHLNGEVGVCKRNQELKENKDNAYWKVVYKYNIPDKLKALNIALQGELCGPGIQKNRLELKEPDVFFFNAYAINTAKYYDYREFKKLIEYLGLKTVPIEEVSIFKPEWDIDYLLKRAEGVYVGTKNQKEGIVIRPTIEKYSEILKGRLSIKVLNNLYLLKEE